VEEYRVRVTKNFKIVIPAPIRDKLGLRAGDSLVVRLEGDRIIVEKPKGDVTALRIRLGQRVDWRLVEEAVAEAAEHIADESSG